MRCLWIRHNPFHQKARVFVTAKQLHPSLIIGSKAEARFLVLRSMGIAGYIFTQLHKTNFFITFVITQFLKVTKKMKYCEYGPWDHIHNTSSS